MQKTCTRCLHAKPLSDFPLRAASPGGRAAECKACKNSRSKHAYFTRDAVRQPQIERTIENKRKRFEESPAYKRAFNLWGSTKKRGTKIPSWVSIVDFVPICQMAIDLGPEWEIDHRYPLFGRDVCGLHVPDNLQVIPKETNRLKARH
jgi:hypothetical protein